MKTSEVYLSTENSDYVNARNPIFGNKSTKYLVNPCPISQIKNRISSNQELRFIYK
jgi:hypothetical protein